MRHSARSSMSRSPSPGAPPSTGRRAESSSIGRARARCSSSGHSRCRERESRNTVLDLVAVAPTFDRAYSWIARAVSRKLVTVAALRAALADRRRIRWREWLVDALQDADDGVYSSLERRYIRDVERAHGLPRSAHQARRLLDGKVQYRDNWYPRYRVAVEVDGPDYHQNERVQLDKDRDNRNLALDDVKTHRFGPVGVTEHACQSAALISATLQRNGWDGVPHSCRRPDCTIGSRAPRSNRKVPG